jgi:hypothetical protein
MLRAVPAVLATNSVRVLVDSHGFRVALLVGAAGVVVAVLLAHTVRLYVGFGVVAVVATVVGFRAQYTTTGRFLLGLALLAVGGGLAGHLRHRVLHVVVAAPGAAFVAWSLPHVVAGWIKVFVFFVIMFGAPLVAGTDRRAVRVVPALAAVSALGVYACVPDTEFARILVGGFVAAAFIGFDPKLRAISFGTFPAVGVIAWTVGLEGYGRPGSVVGGAACLGALLLVPVVWRRVTVESPWAPAAWALAAVHVGLVAWCARVAGFRHGRGAALALAILGYAVAAVLLIALRRVRTSLRSG